MPRSNQIYTLEEVVNVLYLRDSPALFIPGIGCIQDSHLQMGCEGMLTVPGLKETKWRYIRETTEWIPIFGAVEDAENMALVMAGVDYEPYDKENLGCGANDDLNWVTPKGFPRPQHE